jgi:hypothetical protein
MQIGTHSRAVGLHPKSADLQTVILLLKLTAFRDCKLLEGRRIIRQLFEFIFKSCYCVEIRSVTPVKILDRDQKIL